MSTNNVQIARDFIETCNRYGFTFSTRGSIITVEKLIRAGSNEDFADAESQSSNLLSMIPMTSPGSIWGTDGLSVGGYTAMKTGGFRMNKSGCSKRVLNAIKKNLADRYK